MTDLTLLSVCVSNRVKCFAEFLKWFGSVVSSIINTENWSPISSYYVGKVYVHLRIKKVAIESGMLKKMGLINENKVGYLNIFVRQK